MIKVLHAAKWVLQLSLEDQVLELVFQKLQIGPWTYENWLASTQKLLV
jgi:hypothetical protein